MKINDKVLARTHLMRCRLVGTIIAIDGEQYTIKLTFPIRGEDIARVSRADLELIPEKETKVTTNHKIKKESNRIIEHLESIADQHEQRKAQGNTQRITDIPSNNWLDYMKANDIE